MQLNTDLLSKMVRERRGNRGLREVATEIGDISAPTLSRIENGKVPDVETFVRVCRWLEVSTEIFVPGETSEGGDQRSKIVTLLRADRELDSKTCEALIRMIDLAYNRDPK